MWSQDLQSPKNPDGGAHLYVVRNTFVEHVDDDPLGADHPARMRRSSSWSQSVTSSSAPSSAPTATGSSRSSRASHEGMPACTVTLYPRGVENPSSDETPSSPRSVVHINNSYIASLPRHSTRRQEEEFTEASHVLFSSTTSSVVTVSAKTDTDSKSGTLHKGIAGGKSDIIEFSEVPTPRDGGTESDALDLHFKEMCKPCLRFILRDGCKDGDGCKYCHQVHPDTKKLRQRPCKLVRQQCKQVIQQLRDSHPEDREKRLDELQLLVQPHSPYMRSLLMHTIKDIEDPAPTLHRVGQITASSSLAPGSSKLMRDPTPAALVPGLISTAGACGGGPQLPAVPERTRLQRGGTGSDEGSEGSQDSSTRLSL